MEKEEMIEKLKIIYEKTKGYYDKRIYFNQYVPTYYEFPSFYGNNRKKTIEKLKERNAELGKELRCLLRERDKLNSDISFLHNLIFSVSKDIKEIIEDSNEERNVYTIATAEGTEIRIRFPELLAPVLEGYQLVKSDEGAYSFEKVDKWPMEVGWWK